MDESRSNSRKDIERQHLEKILDRYSNNEEPIKDFNFEQDKFPKPPGYWMKIENVILEANKLMNKLGTDVFPSREIIKKYKLTSLVNAVEKYHGGMPKFRKLLGQKTLKKPPGHWTLEKITKEIETLMEDQKFSQFPTQEKLATLGRFDLIGGISNHGGLSKVRKHMGFGELRFPDGHWKNIENVFTEVNRVMEENRMKNMPSLAKLKELGCSSTAISAISTLHGGDNNFRKKFGLNQTRVQKDHWKDIENIASEMRIIMKKHKFKTPPSTEKLHELGYGKFVSGIYYHKRKYSDVLEYMGFKSSKKPIGHWKDVDNLLNELRYLMLLKNSKNIPSGQELRDLKRADLDNAISRHHGGYRKVAKLLNLEQTRKDPGYWKNIDNVVKEVDEFIEKYSCQDFPTARQFQKLGHSTIPASISQHHGGIESFRKYYDQKKNILSERNQLENLLNTYSEDKP